MKTLTILLTLLLAIGAGARGKYTTFDLGPNARFNNVTAINDSGQVLGWWPTNGEAYVISPGDVWTRNIVKTNGSPLFMNNSATIVGNAGHTGLPFYEVRGQEAVTYPGGCGRQIYGGFIVSVYGGINTAGYVAGTCVIDYRRSLTGIFWGETTSDTYSVIPFPRDKKYPNEFVVVNLQMGLNNLNQIVGSWENYSTPWSGFFYDSTSKNLNTTFNMPGAVYTYPVSINDNQEVVGNWVDGNDVQHGFYWNATTGFSNIDVAGDTYMQLIGINNQSVILGFWVDDNTPRLNHVVTIVNGKPTASIKVPQSLAGFTWGAAINNVGQVVGTYETQAGVWRGFIYTPPN
jgi:probable HAF family extracellular repeat protein